MDQQLESNWTERLQPFAQRLNPLHEQIFQKIDAEYYWSAFQCEWASDILFKPGTLARLEPLLLRRGLMNFSSPDIMRFLGNTQVLRAYRSVEGGPAMTWTGGPCAKASATDTSGPKLLRKLTNATWTLSPLWTTPLAG